MSRRTTTLSLPQQAFALRARFPKVRADLKPGRLIWTGCIQPTPLSRTYRVEVACSRGGILRVRVLEPSLDGRPGQPLPHVYGDGTLCLHLDGEWTQDMLIVDTTLPWTSEWLINYEIWTATGDWYGGGEWQPARRADADLKVSGAGSGTRTAAKTQPTTAAKTQPT